jgi:hypothetical protein
VVGENVNCNGGNPKDYVTDWDSGIPNDDNGSLDAANGPIGDTYCPISTPTASPGQMLASTRTIIKGAGTREPSGAAIISQVLASSWSQKATTSGLLVTTTTTTRGCSGYVAPECTVRRDLRHAATLCQCAA